MRQSLFNEIIKHQRPLVQCNDSKIKRPDLYIRKSCPFFLPRFYLTYNSYKWQLFYGCYHQQQKIFYYSGRTWQLYDIKGRVKHKLMYLSLVFRENDTLLILSRQVEKRILDTLMDPKVYDARIRPSGANDTDSATVVIVNIFVRSFSKIDDVKMVSSCASHINLSNRNIISIFIK